jgi:hypothetical protein
VRIDPETYEEWQAHPITEALYRVCAVGIEQAGAAWMAATLEGGSCDPGMLREIRARIAVLREIRAMTAHEIEERLE